MAMNQLLYSRLIWILGQISAVGDVMGDESVFPEKVTRIEKVGLILGDFKE